MNAVSFIHAEKAAFSVTTLCRVVGISRSQYYAQSASSIPNRKREDAALAPVVQAIFDEGRGNYGSPRVHDELGRRGHRVSRKRVIRLMTAQGLAAKTKRKFKATTDSNHSEPIAPNLLQREFTVAAPDIAWVSDITYLRTREGWGYLATVIDLYSRRMVGWALANRMSAKLVCDAFDMAVARRKITTNLIFHSDRGSQYASKKLRRRLARYGMRQSMSRKGDCWDNAVAESFFATLKKELVRGCDFDSHSAALQAVFEYIEVYYNRTRKHSYLNGVSPQQFESCKQQAVAA